MRVPRPQPSPSLPPLPAEGKTDPAAPVTAGRHKRDLRKTTALATVLATLVGGILSSPRVQEAGTKLLGQKGRLEHVEERLNGVELDMRALYQAVLTGRRQPRLEEVPDGGTTP